MRAIAAVLTAMPTRGVAVNATLRKCGLYGSLMLRVLLR
jgi:hypothetical protein